MDRKTIWILSVVCYVLLPIGFAYIGFPIFFTGLDQLHWGMLGSGTIILVLVPLIPHVWTRELLALKDETTNKMVKNDG